MQLRTRWGRQSANGAITGIIITLAWGLLGWDVAQAEALGVPKEIIPFIIVIVGGATIVGAVIGALLGSRLVGGRTGKIGGFIVGAIAGPVIGLIVVPVVWAIGWAIILALL